MSRSTPRQLVKTLQNCDPRLELDQLFWSHYRASNDHKEIEQWCNEMLGEENWYRLFNKYWFTSESEYVMFRLVWSTGVNNERDRIQT